MLVPRGIFAERGEEPSRLVKPQVGGTTRLKARNQPSRLSTTIAHCSPQVASTSTADHAMTSRRRARRVAKRCSMLRRTALSRPTMRRAARSRALREGGRGQGGLRSWTLGGASWGLKEEKKAVARRGIASEGDL